MSPVDGSSTVFSVVCSLPPGYHQVRQGGGQQINKEGGGQGGGGRDGKISVPWGGRTRQPTLQLLCLATARSLLQHACCCWLRVPAG